MSNAKLQPVLDRIDADFDNSLERLFALLRIKSISADPANAGDCKAAADHLARDIATLGFTAEVKPTAGHPAVLAKMNGSTDGRAHVLFYGHYDVQPVDPLNLWTRPPFEARIRKWVSEGAEHGQFVFVRIGQRVIALLPDRDVDLGRVDSLDEIMVSRKPGPSGPAYDVEVRRAKAPASLA